MMKMFDPTAYDNIKVVIEGEIYDLDLAGVVRIVKRSDNVDLASMSRCYQLTFRLGDNTSLCEATILLSADLRNLASELINYSEQKGGCHLEIVFSMKVNNPNEICPKINDVISEEWGKNRMIKQMITYPYGKAKITYKIETSILFERLIYEENIDDLIMMIPFIKQTLATLENLLTKEAYQ